MLFALMVPATLFAGPSASAVGGDTLTAREQNGTVSIQYDGRPLLEYRSVPHPYKVYVSRWYTPKGVQILRDSPHDHVHHHALMYAIGIDKIDFWGEVGRDKNGRQVPRSTSSRASLSDGRGRAVIEQAIDWVEPGGTNLARETRAIRVHVGAIPDVSLLTWQMRLVPAAGRTSAELWGRHYFGLGMRFVTSMDRGGRFFHSGNDPGKPVRGSEKLTRADWCAFTAKADGKQVTVAMFDDPANPRHPATWFTMTTPFAYLAATLNLEQKPMVITSAKPLEARYGIALWDGRVAPEAVQKAYDAWRKTLARPFNRPGFLRPRR